MNIRKFENIHILLWLLKDLCWVTLSETIAVIMVIPTVALAFYIAWLSRIEKAELYHNLAVCCWIMANSIWMIGELFYNDQTRNMAILFFTIGLLLIFYYYLFILLPGRNKDVTNKISSK
jgi:predicted permease